MTASQRKSPKRWSAQEDAVLHEAVTKQHSSRGSKDWHRIAQCLPGRSNKDCRKRWVNQVRGGLRKGAWKEDEDDRLRQAISKHGLKWTLVASEVGFRSADRMTNPTVAVEDQALKIRAECAKRWQHNLDPAIKHGDWTEKEDESLLKAVKRHGRKWKRIQTQGFSNRSRNDLKNRYTILTRNGNSSDDICSDDDSTHASSCDSTESESDEDTDADFDFATFQEYDSVKLIEESFGQQVMSPDKYDFFSSILGDPDPAQIWHPNTPIVSDRDTVTSSGGSSSFAFSRVESHPHHQQPASAESDTTPYTSGPWAGLSALSAVDATGMDSFSLGESARFLNMDTSPPLDAEPSSSYNSTGTPPTNTGNVLATGAFGKMMVGSDFGASDGRASESLDVTMRIEGCARTTLKYLLDVTQRIEGKVKMEVNISRSN